MTTTAPRISTVILLGYLADSATYAVNVTYPGENPRRVTFTGDPYHGGPVVMTHPTIAPGGMFIDDPARFGPFGPQWVERFYA